MKTQYQHEEWTVVWRETYAVQVASFNPPSRTSIKSLADLEREIREVGQILVPLALTCDEKLADGHRRLAVAKRLAMPEVPCHIYEECNQQKLWSMLSKGMKPVLSSTWMESYRHGLNLENFPDRQRGQVESLKRLLNQDEFQRFIDQRRSPGILDSAYYVAHYCGDNSDEFVHAVLVWAMNYQQMRLLRNAIADGLDQTHVIEIILTNRKMLRYG